MCASLCALRTALMHHARLRDRSRLLLLCALCLHFARLPHQEIPSAVQYGLRLRNHVHLILVTSPARSSAAAIFLLHLLAVLSISWSVVASRSRTSSRAFSARLTACWTCVVRVFALADSLSHAPATLADGATQHGARLRRCKPAHVSCILELRQCQHFLECPGKTMKSFVRSVCLPDLSHRTMS